MKYRVTLDSYALDLLHSQQNPPIPGTCRIGILDPEVGQGKVIWDGYLKMEAAQKGEVQPDSFPKVHLTSTHTEINRFREALNLFFRSFAGVARDNCKRVSRIEQAHPDDPDPITDTRDIAYLNS